MENEEIVESPKTQEKTKFPFITIKGATVDAKRFIEPGTSMALTIAWIIGIPVFLIACIASYGIFLLLALFYPLFSWYLHKKASALIHGSGVHVGPKQLPEIYECMETLKQRLNITKQVDIYVVEDNVVNAAAVKLGKKNVILLTDDIVHSILVSTDPRVLSFVIAHELAHIALGHNSIVRQFIGGLWKKLSRLDEYSSDSVALALIGSKELAFQGMLLLTVGYSMIPYINIESIIQQAKEVARNKYSIKAERQLTHPLLLNRIYHILTKR